MATAASVIALPPPPARARPLLAPSHTKLPPLRLKAAPWPIFSCKSCTVTRTRCLEAWGGGAHQVVQQQEPAQAEPNRVRLVLCALAWLALTLGFGCDVSFAAAEDSIKASGFGLKVAAALRGLGWPDEAVVFALATLPVLELRGAIPVAYWMKLHPVRLTLLSVLGNMVPVPFIILYLKKLATFLSRKSASATRILDRLFERAREKAGPVEEFQWLGLMLFVAVPFPGTGAWTGAIIASVLGMPFWSAVSANFVGVVLAGLLVNLLMNMGLKYAIITGVVLFFVSTAMWSVLRSLKKTLNAK